MKLHTFWKHPHHIPQSYPRPASFKDPSMSCLGSNFQWKKVFWQTLPRYPSTWPTHQKSGLHVCSFGYESETDRLMMSKLLHPSLTQGIKISASNCFTNEMVAIAFGSILRYHIRLECLLHNYDSYGLHYSRFRFMELYWHLWEFIQPKILPKMQISHSKSP